MFNAQLIKTRLTAVFMNKTLTLEGDLSIKFKNVNIQEFVESDLFEYKSRDQCPQAKSRLIFFLGTSTTLSSTLGLLGEAHCVRNDNGFT